MLCHILCPTSLHGRFFFRLKEHFQGVLVQRLTLVVLLYIYLTRAPQRTILESLAVRHEGLKTQNAFLCFHMLIVAHESGGMHLCLTVYFVRQQLPNG